jgi:allantoate deiminase
MARANELVAGWMRAAGMKPRVDTAGNLIGRYPGPDTAAGVLLLGSHLDTVRDAGAYDGPLGVLVAVACVERLHRAGRRLPFTIDVAAFADEEGTRFGVGCLGSRALAGTFGDDLLTLVDDDGVTLADALRAFGGDPAAIGAAARDGERLLGYCEVHIEQGPALERLGIPLGAVSAIAGATRAEIVFAGAAGHAGTVPMHARRDALAAAAEWVLAVERAGAATVGMVATVGVLDVRPAAANVIPGSARATVDVRHADDATRRRAVDDLRERASDIARARGLAARWRLLDDTPTVAMDERLSDALAVAARACSLEPVRLPSGAGHDAVALSERMPVAMLFVRCAGGVSHCPEEAVDAADVEAAVAVLDRFLLDLGAGA